MKKEIEQLIAFLEFSFQKCLGWMIAIIVCGFIFWCIPNLTERILEISENISSQLGCSLSSDFVNHVHHLRTLKLPIFILIVLFISTLINIKFIKQEPETQLAEDEYRWIYIIIAIGSIFVISFYPWNLIDPLLTIFASVLIPLYLTGAKNKSTNCQKNKSTTCQKNTNTEPKHKSKQSEKNLNKLIKETFILLLTFIVLYLGIYHYNILSLDGPERKTQIFSVAIAIFGWIYTNQKNRKTNQLIENTKEQYAYNTKVRNSLTEFLAAATKINENRHSKSVAKLKKELISAYWQCSLYQISIENPIMIAEDQETHPFMEDDLNRLCPDDVNDLFKLNIKLPDHRGLDKANPELLQKCISWLSQEIYLTFIKEERKHTYSEVNDYILKLAKLSSLFTYVKYYDAKEELLKEK